MGFRINTGIEIPQAQVPADMTLGTLPGPFFQDALDGLFPSLQKGEFLPMIQRKTQEVQVFLETDDF